MTGAMSPVPADHPLMVAWNAYQATEDYANSKRWALRLRPSAQVGSPEAETTDQEIATLKTREQFVEGSLWAAFMAGFNAARPTT